MTPFAITRIRSVHIAACALAATLGFTACTGDDTGTTVIIRHGAVPAPAFTDGGEPGPSAGDTRIFHFDAETAGGEPVVTNWVMITTAVDSPANDVESRTTTGVFAVGDGTDDQLILEGVAFYPGEEATLDVSATVLRAVVGGTGRFSGARGDVASTRFDDGSWEHVFRLEN
jgi:hypothetical protein